MDTTCTTRFRVSVALALLAAFCAISVVSALPSRADAVTLDYGTLSRKYETGGDPTDAVSYSGYGAYQMLQDNALDYATWLSKKKNATYRSWGRGLIAARAHDKAGSYLYFNAMWRYVAGMKLSALSKSDRKRVNEVLKTVDVHAGSRKKALALQYSFALKAYYKPALKYWEKVAPGFKDTDYSVALRSVLFSIAVASGPYGSAYSILKPTLETLGGWKKGLDEKKLIKALYNERSKAVKKAPGKPAHKITKKTPNAKKYKLVGKYLKHYYSSSAAVQVAVYKRFRYDEKNDALKLYEQVANCKHAKTTGGEVTRYFDITDISHKEERAAKVCLVCGETVEQAGTYTVENAYVMKGATYKDASGKSYTVHGKGTYSVAAAGVRLRKAASASSKSRGKVAKSVLLKITKSKLGSDGFWWGKTTYAKKRGWVRMEYLSPMGTASAHSYNKNGTCRYCGITRSQEAAIAKILKGVKKGGRTCVLTIAGSSYKAAYSVSTMLDRKRPKDTKVTVVKVVRNVYNDYWAKLSDGSYIDLALLK